jgi:hypothetical protein
MCGEGLEEAKMLKKLPNRLDEALNVAFCLLERLNREALQNEGRVTKNSRTFIHEVHWGNDLDEHCLAGDYPVVELRWRSYKPDSSSLYNIDNIISIVAIPGDQSLRMRSGSLVEFGEFDNIDGYITCGAAIESELFQEELEEEITKTYMNLIF